MSPEELKIWFFVAKFIGAPVALAFVSAMAAHLVMLFKLPRRLDRAVVDFDTRFRELTTALENETEERKRESALLREVLMEIKDTLRKHSDTLRVHGEGIAALRSKTQ